LILPEREELEESIKRHLNYLDRKIAKAVKENSFLIVAWGRELTPDEKRLNDILINEGKAEKCLAYERWFNKSFKKRLRHCEQGIER
jgi:hypothetical protein